MGSGFAPSPTSLIPISILPTPASVWLGFATPLNVFDQDNIVNLACLYAFGRNAVLHSRAAGGDVSILAIPEDQFQHEDFQPGLNPGVNNLSVFVHYEMLSNINLAPVRGDTLTISGVLYNIMNVDVDAGGGASLKMLRR